MLKKITLLLLALLCLNTTINSQNCEAPIGMNLGELQHVLVDVFKTARPFWEGNISTFEWDTGNALSLDADGYPTSINTASGAVARTLFMEGLFGEYSAGTYTVLYDGRGVVYLDDVWDASNIMYDTSYAVHGGINNRITFDVTSPSDLGLLLEIRATSPSDYVRNIRVIRPDDAGTDYLNTYSTSYFRSVLYDRLENYSVLRFMDWMATNFSPVQTWNDRTLLSNQRWSSNFGEGAGVPIELIIQLANQTGITPWICIPHQADDNYVQQLATQLEQELNPTIPIYLEYSNELWNAGFYDDAWFSGQSGQHDYALSQGAANGWSDYYERVGKWTAQRSVEVFDIFNTVFGANANRIQKVMSIQNGPDLGTPHTLDHIVNGSPAWQQADFLAGAPYFGGDFDEFTPGISGWSVDQLLDSIEARLFRDFSSTYWAEETMNLLNSAPYNGSLEYITYEGGQHLYNLFGQPIQNGGAISQLFVDANRHPRMGDIYTDYLDWWHHAGGGLMVLFTHTATPNWGSFGILESIDQDVATAPKYLAVQDWISDFCMTVSLPVELMYFKGEAQGKTNRLVWTAAQEENVVHYEIQKLTSDWESIGRQIPLEHSPENYQFIDEKPQIGSNYYRLKTIGIDGEISYSHIVTIDNPLGAQLGVLMPTLVQSNAQLSIESPAYTDFSIQIIGANGQIVQTKTMTCQKGTNTIELSFQHLPIGIYSLQLQSGQHQEVIRFVKAE